MHIVTVYVLSRQALESDFNVEAIKDSNESVCLVGNNHQYNQESITLEVLDNQNKAFSVKFRINN